MTHVDDAQRIAQHFLDDQGAITLSGDLEATLDCCDIPCVMESAQGRVVATNKDDLRAVFTRFMQELNAKRVTYLVRECLEASFTDDSTICAAYKTRYVVDGNFRAEDPYFGLIILRFKSGRWRVSNIQFDVSHTSPVNVTLREWTKENDARERT